MRKILSILFLGIFIQLSAQPDNDECQFATFIPSVDEYCSNPGQFTNVEALPDQGFDNFCFLNYENGVWFSFVPREPAVIIQVFGNSGLNGSLQFPKIALFSDCGEFIECSPGKNEGNDELVQDGLIIGQLYYVMVESAIGNEGTFTMCIDEFVAPKAPEADCGNSVVLCDKSPFTIQNLNTAGSNTNEVDGSCIQQEFASSWYTWTCDDPGTLTFDLIPNDFGINAITDDLDFAIYELPNGINNCSNKVLVRCMASGANTLGNGAIAPLSEWAACNGITGLRAGETDTNEDPGCLAGSSNFIAPLNMESGKSYALVINNFSRSGLGFHIEFGGTGTFLGPQPDFDLTAVQAFECDKTVIFNNLSFSETDSIISYEWNFGVGSDDPFKTGPGPHDIIYESFGDKIAALTVETSRGCRVTKVLDFPIEACCADTSNLAVNADIRDIICHGDATGQITSTGRNGAPQYSYSLDGQNFQPNPRFTRLIAGEYLVYIQDIKGCVNATTVVIEEPPPLIVTATGDTTIDLGLSTPISASHSPPGSDVTYTWSPPDGLSCDDCPDPVSMTPGTTSYIVTIEDEAGCTSTDTVTIRVNSNYQIYTPNIFSPNEDGNNDNFPVFGNIAADAIEEMIIFDRWGNKVYESQSMVLNDRTSGWDGRFLDKFVNPGVFTWVAKVRFIDGVVETFTGDITVLR
ncbi:MAG: T9SS type B sorting domain-containing protein [Saprospiraceae bacterium]|nr:T9SS type B sorting domain-containing protein [Saprospiraceae bacterium]